MPIASIGIPIRRSVRIRARSRVALGDQCPVAAKRARSRRSARVFVIGLAMSETHRNGTFWMLKAGKAGTHPGAPRRSRAAWRPGCGSDDVLWAITGLRATGTWP
jgi:hypothetical protein